MLREQNIEHVTWRSLVVLLALPKEGKGSNLKIKVDQVMLLMLSLFYHQQGPQQQQQQEFLLQGRQLILGDRKYISLAGFA